jgi:hypothetical protein
MMVATELRERSASRLACTTPMLLDTRELQFS